MHPYNLKIIRPLQKEKNNKINEPPYRKASRLILKKYENRWKRPRGKFINRVIYTINTYSNIMRPSDILILIKYRMLATNYYNSLPPKRIKGNNRWERKMLYKNDE
jgi:hypothetical protein